MNKNNMFFRMLNAVENLFMKNYSCICCYKEIPDETEFMLCEKCKEDIEFLNNNICKKCGDKLNDNRFCINDCNKFHYSFDENISICYYTKSAARIIKNLKYGRHKYLADYVASLILKRKNDFCDVDVILYVPSSKNRLQERGFNQAKEIAKVVADALGKDCIDAIIKIKDTIHQAGGTQKDRMKNLAGSFAVDSKYEEYLKNKKVLIVDDVFTTGSTLNECAKIVRKFKPKMIKTLTFAKTKFNLTQNN